MPAIDAAIEQAEGAGPLLLIEASPLARYDKLSMLSRWTDLAAPRPRAVWLLVPQLCAVERLAIPAARPCRGQRADNGADRGGHPLTACRTAEDLG